MTSRRRQSLFSVEYSLLDHGIAVLCHSDEPKSKHQASNKSVMTTHSNKQNEKVLFKHDIVRNLAREVLEYHLNGMEYRRKESDDLCKEIITDIQKKMAVLNYERYKVVCTCILSSIDKPPMFLESRLLWNSKLTCVDSDSYVDFVFKNEEFYAIVTIFAIYSQSDPEWTNRTLLSNLVTTT